MHSYLKFSAAQCSLATTYASNDSKSYHHQSIKSRKLRLLCSRNSYVNCRFSSNLKQQQVELDLEDDVHKLLQILPCDLHDSLQNGSKEAQLLEVILDLGRLPIARYLGVSGQKYLRDTEVSVKELEYALEALGEFGGDNRAGIAGTLHRISAVRNRKGEVVGLTCRVGRAVRGHIDMVQDLLEFGESILFVGRPGVGKTTVMREISRILSDELHKRVVIVDTSNEIGGGGNIPHPAIGGARRLQVPEPSMQHRVMIEAAENHMPEVIVIDEIGTQAEVQACRSIAERGVMLIGTAHGEQLENIISNPTLSDLIGGVETVTIGDQEARNRNSRKSIRERKSPPTFPFLIEIGKGTTGLRIELREVWIYCFMGKSRWLRVFEKSREYVTRFSRYKNPDAVRQVREILSGYSLAEFELCVLGNLCPDTVGEATAMIPSIKTAGNE